MKIFKNKEEGKMFTLASSSKILKNINQFLGSSASAFATQIVVIYIYLVLLTFSCNWFIIIGIKSFSKLWISY